MGSLYLRGKTWWMKFYINGAPVQKSTGTTKKMVAREVMRAAETEAEKLAALPEQERVKLNAEFGDLVKLFITDYRMNGRKSEKRAIISTKHLEKFFGSARIGGITSQMIRDYISKRVESVCSDCGVKVIGDRVCPACGSSKVDKGAANATINRELSALKRMFVLGADQTPPLVGKAPKIMMLKENNTRKGFFEHAEFLAVSSALPPHLRPVVLFAYKTGWRQGEILSLKWNQIDRMNRYARIDTSKNGEPRTVYFDDELAGSIEALWSRRKDLRSFCDHVFLEKSGKNPVLRFDKAWRTACKAAGVDRIFHDLRRTAVRNMVRAGVPEGVAMKISGHRTRAVFERYNIVNDQDLKNAAAKQAEYLDGQNAMVTNLATERDKKAKAV